MVRDTPIFVLDRIAQPLSAAACHFARQAHQIEQSVQLDPDPSFSDAVKLHYQTEQSRLIQLAASTVIMTVAGWEADMNERLQICADPRLGTISATQDSLTPEARREWAKLWRAEMKRELNLNPLEKTLKALELAGLESLPLGQGSAQDFALLLRLRDALVHAKPVYRRHGRSVPQKDKDPLEAALCKKFPPSKLAHHGEPYLWRHCLGAGCAVWAVQTVTALHNDVNKRMGIQIRAEFMI